MTTALSVPLAALLDEAAAQLRKAGLEGARFEARALAGAVLGLAREAMVADPRHPIDADAAARFRAAVARRAAREPFARIAGRREFWSLDFVLSPDTLVPRPETEGVVESVLKELPDRNAALSILDLGTGTGCILLALLTELPNARGIGIDSSEGAIATARLNAERLHLDSRARFRNGDWLTDVDGQFDVIVSNPPYVAEGDRISLEPEVRDHEPPCALFAGEDGLDAFRIIVPELPRALVPGGFAALECGAGQGSEVAELLRQAGLAAVQLKVDLAGIERVVSARSPAPDEVKKNVGKRGITV